VAGCANVIFHVASAQNATRVHIFKPRDHFVRSFARGVNHDVEAPAMAHSHDGFDGAVFARASRIESSSGMSEVTPSSENRLVPR